MDPRQFSNPHRSVTRGPIWIVRAKWRDSGEITNVGVYADLDRAQDVERRLRKMPEVEWCGAEMRPLE